MPYDSTGQESLIKINVMRTNSQNRDQWYRYLGYAIIIKNKSVKHWAFKETF